MDIITYAVLKNKIGTVEGEISDLQAYIGYTDPDIYGLEVDFENNRFIRLAGAVGKSGGADFDSIRPWGGRRRCNLTDDGVVVAYYGDPAFATGGSLTQAVTVDGVTYPIGTAVQVMVEQPKFYYRVVPLKVDPIDGGAHGYALRHARYYISATPKVGFKIHPAFVRAGNENDYIYLSAFEGCVYDVSAAAYILDDAQIADFTATTGDKLSSIANAKPASGLTQNLSLVNMRTLAHNRGIGWEQIYATTISASQILMAVEYAMFDMQSAIGLGVTDKGESSDNNAEITGATITLGNKSGEAATGNDQKLVSYRGEENLWGNMWKMVDGLKIKFPDSFGAGDFGRVYVADHDFAEDHYYDTGLYPPYSANSYIRYFGYSPKYDYLFIPSVIGGNSSLPVGDTLYSMTSGDRASYIGGRWVSQTRPGPFALTTQYASNYKARYLNGRLVYIPSAKLEI